MAGAGVNVAYTFVGDYMTSLDMAGCSITVFVLDNELEGYLTAPSQVPSFMVSELVANSAYAPLPADTAPKKGTYTIQTNASHAKTQNNKLDLNNVTYIVDLLAKEIIEREDQFSKLDSVAGDGDFGASIAKGFRRLKDEWAHVTTANDIGDFLENCAMIIMEHCGGASGPVWGSAFRGMAKSTAKKSSLDTQAVADMLKAAVQSIQATGERSFGRGAVVGDKTLIDALIPCAEQWQKSAKNNDSLKEALQKGAKAAKQGADSTKDIVARMGRAGNVGERSLGHPDAGAQALAVLFEVIAKEVE